MTQGREPRDPRPPPTRTGPHPARPFPRAVLEGPTVEAARAILGARLVRDPSPAGGAQRRGVGGRQRRVGRIVEVEAYVGLDDQASHARMGPTARNTVMFGPAGIAYVYLVYGMYHCLNVVTEPPGTPAALLVRAVEPIEGIEAMREAREASRRPRPSALQGAGRVTRPIADARLAAGPGLVCAAFDIDRSHTGLDLCDAASPLRLEARPDDEPAPPIIQTPRVGIGYAGEPWVSVPWRFVAAGAPTSGRPR